MYRRSIEMFTALLKIQDQYNSIFYGTKEFSADPAEIAALNLVLQSF